MSGDNEFPETFEDTSVVYAKAEKNLRILAPLIAVHGIILFANAVVNFIQMTQGKGMMNFFPFIIYLIFGIWHLQAARGLQQFNNTASRPGILRFSDRIAFYFMIQGILIIIIALVIGVIAAINMMR